MAVTQEVWEKATDKEKIEILKKEYPHVVQEIREKESELRKEFGMKSFEEARKEFLESCGIKDTPTRETPEDRFIDDLE